MVINSEERLLTLKEGEGWRRTAMDDDGRCGQDDGRIVTFSHDDLKTVKGQNHNFYSRSFILHRG